jgi:predicted nucleic acid-binding protein
MSSLVFVDANVFVYARDPRDARKQARARQWLSGLWRERSGRTSMQVLSEFYTVATRKLAQPVAEDLAWDDIARYLSWRPQAIDEAVLRLAREIERRYRLSWWDDLVVAAAQLQGCSVLLTEDLQDGMVFGTLRARSPFTLAAGEPESDYAVQHIPVSLHRPRGRPRRVAARA